MISKKYTTKSRNEQLQVTPSLDISRKVLNSDRLDVLFNNCNINKKSINENNNISFT